MGPVPKSSLLMLVSGQLVYRGRVAEPLIE
ncbi:hypothetical protein E2C01_089990 [Portunus trituberculatus]|uniref:Uncharacterized protein n=1 Tax=Portunus trituberculatus TaxID=210409 RepID=A0A5B7JR31_PORTR|nr:hypothetical protein [Portunus trituberculatus]